MNEFQKVLFWKIGIEFQQKSVILALLIPQSSDGREALP